MFEANTVPATGTEVTVGLASQSSNAVKAGITNVQVGLVASVVSCVLIIIGGNISDEQVKANEPQDPESDPKHVGFAAELGAFVFPAKVPVFVGFPEFVKLKIPEDCVI